MAHHGTSWHIMAHHGTSWHIMALCEFAHGNNQTLDFAASLLAGISGLASADGDIGFTCCASPPGT